jgi:hypothetical protein
MKARNGAWTPWARVLCDDCDYDSLKNSPSASVFASRVQSLASRSRQKKIEQPDSETLIGTCDGCGCKCWVRDDVALLQRISAKTTDLGGPTSHMEQTGGMCAALAIDTEHNRIRITAMDGGFAVCEYERIDGEWWDHLRRTWDSAMLFEDGAWKADRVLKAAIEECARKVIEFSRPVQNS